MVPTGSIVGDTFKPIWSLVLEVSVPSISITLPPATSGAVATIWNGAIGLVAPIPTYPVMSSTVKPALHVSAPDL